MGLSFEQLTAAESRSITTNIDRHTCMRSCVHRYRSWPIHPSATACTAIADKLLHSCSVATAAAPTLCQSSTAGSGRWCIWSLGTCMYAWGGLHGGLHGGWSWHEGAFELS